MPSQSSQAPTSHVLQDIRGVRELGFLQHFPLALAREEGIDEKSQPRIRLGNIPLTNLHWSRFRSRLDPGWMLVVPGELRVYLETLGRGIWLNAVKAYVTSLLGRYGLRITNFKLELRGLYLAEVTDALERKQISNKERCEGSFASILIDLLFPGRGGEMTICATREGRMESFNFSATSYSVMNWFHDTTVTIEPLPRGGRALLVYDICPEHSKPSFVYFCPYADLLRDIVEQVKCLVPRHDFRQLRRKTCYMPLLRMLLLAYQTNHLDIPVACQELFIRVVRCYETRVQGAINSLAQPVVLLDLQEEGREIVQSFGGPEGVHCILGREYFLHIMRIMKELDHQVKLL